MIYRYSQHIRKYNGEGGGEEGRIEERELKRRGSRIVIELTYADTASILIVVVVDVAYVEYDH